MNDPFCKKMYLCYTLGMENIWKNNKENLSAEQIEQKRKELQSGCSTFNSLCY